MTRYLALVLAVSAGAADWNLRETADYMDARQKQWFAWPRANSGGTPCLSCHSGLTYLLARPKLRRALGETGGPTEWERGYLASMKKRLAGPPPKPPGGVVESVLGSLVLVRAEGLSAEARAGLERMWSVQKDGAWAWYALDQDPWEVVESKYFGAAMGALAVGSAPASYREEKREQVAALTKYLVSEYAAQNLHNRMAVLWASAYLPGILSAEEKSKLTAEIAGKQLADGGWALEALGPFKEHSAAPARPAGADAYATAFTAFVLREAGVGAGSLARAQAWLRGRQEGGVWKAASMNRVYPEGSIPLNFMQDAATAYAAMALLKD